MIHNAIYAYNPYCNLGPSVQRTQHIHLFYIDFSGTTKMTHSIDR